MFYTNIDNKVVHVQGYIENYPSSDYITQLIIERCSNTTQDNVSIINLNLNDKEQVRDYMSIIGEVYDDTTYDKKKKDIKLLSNHLFLTETETFLITVNNLGIATITVGQYKDHPTAGGVSTIGVSKKYQNKGIGQLIILYGYAKLNERGLKYGESIIASKRIASLMAHFKLGFIPQYNMKCISYKGALKNINLIQKYRLKKRLRKLYGRYIENFNNNFYERKK